MVQWRGSSPQASPTPGEEGKCLFGSEFLEGITVTLQRTTNDAVKHHLLDALLTMIQDERCAGWVIPSVRKEAVPWLHAQILTAEDNARLGCSQDVRRLMTRVLQSLCPVNVTQIVQMAQTLEALRRIEMERHNAIHGYGNDILSPGTVAAGELQGQDQDHDRDQDQDQDKAEAT